MSRLGLALLGAIVIALALACGGDAQPKRVDVLVSRLAIHAEVANSAAERNEGLSGRESMPQSDGMLFVFPSPGTPTFWMRGMEFPLDLIWMSDNLHVVQVTKNAPPQAGVPDADLTRYVPDEPVQYVLEVNAGVADQGDVLPGDIIAIAPAPPPAKD